METLANYWKYYQGDMTVINNLFTTDSLSITDLRSGRFPGGVVR